MKRGGHHGESDNPLFGSIEVVVPRCLEIVDFTKGTSYRRDWSRRSLAGFQR